MHCGTYGSPAMYAILAPWPHRGRLSRFLSTGVQVDFNSKQCPHLVDAMPETSGFRKASRLSAESLADMQSSCGALGSLSAGFVEEDGVSGLIEIFFWF